MEEDRREGKIDGWRLGNGVEFHTLSMLLQCNYGMVRQLGRLEVLWVCTDSIISHYYKHY